MADTAATNVLPQESGEEAADYSGPKYHAQQKVLCIDTNNNTSDDAFAPLYEAVIRKSELKYIDPTTQKNIAQQKERQRQRSRWGCYCRRTRSKYQRLGHRIVARVVSSRSL
mmetsp:Transcript_9858/g.16725  ORF Transcript_9858/g.16725 Transcript_9858/m.16725 type:complete len:112 (-) Transcript_9858:16-351(-)